MPAGLTAAAPRSLDPFSLADRTITEHVLDRAGFGEVTFTDVHAPVYYGPDVAAALEWVCGFTCVRDVMQRLDPASTASAREHLLQSLAAHSGRDGVCFDSRAWIVTAHRR